jgi:uncharacterized membrane protein
MTLSATLKISLAALAVAVAALAEAHEGHGSTGTHKPTPEEIAAFETAKPVFERHCVRCHTEGGKKSKRKALDHISMDRYPFGGHHADEAGKAVRKALGVEGHSRPTMPSDDAGAVRNEELAKIVAWATAFDRAALTERDNPHPADGSAYAQ